MCFSTGSQLRWPIFRTNITKRRISLTDLNGDLRHNSHFGWLPSFFFLANNILVGSWLNCISSVEITLSADMWVGVGGFSKVDLFKFQLSYYYNPLQDTCPVTSAVLGHLIRTHVPLNIYIYIYIYISMGHGSWISVLKQQKWQDIYIYIVWVWNNS